MFLEIDGKFDIESEVGRARKGLGTETAAGKLEFDCVKGMGSLLGNAGK